MKRLLKWAVVGLGGLLVLGLLAAGLIYLLALQTVQPLSGKRSIAGLEAPVSVVRDAHGIPHIKAQNRTDAAMALGFSHAQDRLWQMEFLRMTGQGRLSEMLGLNKTVQDIDVFLRSLGFLDQVTSSLGTLNEESRALLTAYATGVNAFLTRKTSMFEPALPPEFLILGHSPEPWKPEHSLIVLKIMSLQLSKNMSNEIDRLSLAALGLNSAEIGDIFPHHRDDNPPAMPEMKDWFDLTSPLGKFKLGQSDMADQTYAALKREWVDDLGKWASNNWVLAGNRTKSGKSLLANDPHLTFGAPSLWYLAHLSWPDAGGNVHNEIGATIPAVPAIVLGRNDHLAWGFTNAGGDVQDVMVERVKPDDPTMYLTPDGLQKFEVFEETIKIKGSEDLKFLRRVGRNGPILPRTYKNQKQFLNKDTALALKWTGLSKQDRSFELVAGLSSTRTVAEFGALMDKTVSPQQAIVVADSENNIGLFAKADVPVRRFGNTMQGRAPVPGWKNGYGWLGMVPKHAMTAIVNPLNGAFGTANSRFVSQNKNPFMTYDWDEPFRHDRVTQSIVNANRKLGVDDMIAGQNDAYSPAMIALRDVFVAHMEQPTKYRQAYNLMLEWDGQMKADRPEPLIVTAYFRHALKQVFEDDIKPLFETVMTAPATALYNVLQQGGSRNWCDKTSTEKREECGAVLDAAFVLAMDELSSLYGDNPISWKWGDAHVISNEHQPFGKVNVLKRLFNIERPASGGAYALLRGKTKFTSKRPYRAVHGAGYRAIYNFTDLDKSLYIQSTGQSGNPMSPRYDDQVDLWTAGKYLTMTTREPEYSKGALGTWILEP